MIVVDTHIIGYFFLPSELSHQADRVFRKDPDWAAPVLWRSEFRNVLAGYLRKQLMTLASAQRTMQTALEFMREGEYEVASRSVLDLVAASTCAAYDCEFVALAQDLGLPLVTSNRQILAQFPETAVSLQQFLAA